jgi:N-acetyl-alpha-D-muramate 1-phosphate uridylyltransferase
MKAMIFAAGLGTRLKPFTDHHPKALAPVHGKPLLQWNIEYLRSFGITDIIVNVHHFAQQIIDCIDEHRGFGCHVNISDETDLVLETGGGLKKAADYLQDSDPFVVMNVDILTDFKLDQLIAAHQQHQPLATLAVTDRASSRNFLFDEQMQLCGWRNNKTGEVKMSEANDAPIAKAFSGIHVISPALLPLLNQWEGKFGMVDVYLELSKQYLIRGFDHSDSQLLDVGKPESITQAEAMFQP